MDDYEAIGRAYYLEKKSIRQIAREQHHSRRTIRKAIDKVQRQPYQLVHPKPAPVFGAFQHWVDELLAKNKTFPRKQQYTTHKIYEALVSEGYQGSESRVKIYVAQWRKENKPPDVFLPLDFEPGQDAQCDWGEAVAVIGGVRQVVQVFVMRFCYSRRTFVMCFPTQRQESFLFGHVQAFKYFDGVPARISYDNLATAVRLAMDKGKVRKRTENRIFATFRSHYLFENHFCTPAAGWEKGQVEHGVGFSRRNYMVPIPEAATFDELNTLILERCLQDDGRKVNRQPVTIGEAWEQEKPLLQPLPAFDYDCCEMLTVRLNPYSQVTYETNRYSVPVSKARREVTLKAYPFFIEIFDEKGTHLAHHSRSYGKAKFPVLKDLTSFDFSVVRGITKQRVMELAEGDYLAKKESIILIGNPGLGKTHLATGLALAACKQGKRVRFFSAAALVNDLLAADHTLQLSKFKGPLLKSDLIVLDEVGFIPFTTEGAQSLFQFCSDLHERVSIIVTSNLRFGDWVSIFGDKTMTTALLDRLTGKGHILEFIGESYRFRQRLRQEEQQPTEQAETGS